MMKQNGDLLSFQIPYATNYWRLNQRQLPSSSRGQPLTVTERLSSLSDRLSHAIVTRASKQYATIVRTPEHFVEMLFWIEDKRFPIHFGVDPIAITRAMIFNLRGRARQGASTIAQQVCTIRQNQYHKISRSMLYKVKQIGRSLYLSAAVSKAALLNEYIEGVYWGRSYHGLDKASQGYFGVDRTSLSILQSFFLVERLAAPNRVSPQRIGNLLSRAPIRLSLMRKGVASDDIAKLYERVYGGRGEPWQFLVK